MPSTHAHFVYRLLERAGGSMQASRHSVRVQRQNYSLGLPVALSLLQPCPGSRKTSRVLPSALLGSCAVAAERKLTTSHHFVFGAKRPQECLIRSQGCGSSSGSKFDGPKALQKLWTRCQYKELDPWLLNWPAPYETELLRSDQGARSETLYPRKARPE